MFFMIALIAVVCIYYLYRIQESRISKLRKSIVDSQNELDIARTKIKEQRTLVESVAALDTDLDSRVAIAEYIELTK